MAETSSSILLRVVRAIRSKLVWILLGIYVLAGVAPGPGLAMRAPSLGTIALGPARLELGVPALLLALLIFNASLGVNAAEMKRLVKEPRVVASGLFANAALPLSFTLAASGLLFVWHSQNEIQALLVGLALVSSMPIAGSSTAWAQNAEGNLALSVGLVIASTLLSPFLTPLGFHAIASVTSGDFAEDLNELAGGNAQMFLAVAVVAPSALGMLTHRLVGKERLARVRPLIKLINILVILVLNYSNASVALPRVVRAPDVDLLLLTFGVVATMVALAFLTGRGVGELVRAKEPEKVSLMFALGMNNNGSGLVLAATQLGDHPNIVLTIVAYNIVQQIAAGVFDHLGIRRRRAAERGPPADA